MLHTTILPPRTIRRECGKHKILFKVSQIPSQQQPTCVLMNKLNNKLKLNQNQLSSKNFPNLKRGR